MPVEASVTVIVLNWNGKVLLEDCLGTLEKVEYNNYNVLVVDNGSTDDSVQYIESNFSAVDILELDNNLGYAGGNNAGFKHVLLKYDPEIVVF
jgi:GT2 family glycosyltransferase